MPANPQYSDLPQGATVVSGAPKQKSAPTAFSDLPPGATVVNTGQNDPNNTGIVGPDQTAPTAPKPEGFFHSAASVLGLAPEQMAAANQEAGKHPFKTVLNALDPAAPLKAMAESAVTNIPPLVKKAYGEADAANTALSNRDVPGFLAHEIGGTGYLGAAVASPVLGNAPAKAGEQLGEGNVAGGLGTTTGIIAPIVAGEALRPKTPPLAKVTTPAQESAFNVLHPENAVAKTSILGEVRNAAAKEAAANPANPIRVRLGAEPQINVPKGRAGVELPQKVIQGSIDNHEAQVAAIRSPYKTAAFDPEAAAQAAEGKITDQMRNEARSPNPKTAGRAQAQIDELQSVADRIRTAKDIGSADQLRHALNDELAPELNKSVAAQDVSPAAMQAKRIGASALRQSYYDRLADLSGRDDVRSLAQREGALIEAKAGVTKTANQALMSRRNDLGNNPRITASKRAALKVQLTRPGTIVKAIPDIIQAVVNPDATTPIAQYQNRVMRSLSNLGPATPDAPLYTPLQPAGLLGPGATPLGPSSIQNPSLAPPPIASTTRLQRLGATPPGAAGTFEHVPYNSQANASTLPNAVRVPQQIGAGPNIRGLLPEQVNAAIGLPEKSQSTLTNGRTIESPASNEGVIPALIRDYVNGRTPTEHPDVTAMKNATAHNSPAQAAEFNERGAQQLFGRPYDSLSVPERIQAIRRGTDLQTEAMRTGGASGHSNIGGGSLEELHRGTTLKINTKTGATGVHGGSIDVGNGEAVLRQRPDGSLEVANNNSGVADSEILRKFAGNAAQTFGKPGRAPNTIELIHRSGEHGDVPASRVGDYLSSGEYRLAPRRTK